MNKRLIGNPDLSEATKERIKNIQKQLDEMGTESMHFSWNYEKMSQDLPSLEKVANELCSALEDYFAGNYTEVPPDFDIDEIPEDVKTIMNDSIHNENIDRLFREFDNNRKAFWAAIPFPKYICPFCGCTHSAEEHEKDLVKYADYLCGVCENRTIKEYVRVDR